MLKKLIKFVKDLNNYKNTYFIRYHLLKFIDKLKSPTSPNTKKDTFNWKRYNLHYRGELKEIAKTNTLTIKTNDYSFVASKLIKTNKDIKPLHENWRLLYETILQLKPNSVFEMGCGNGMHLNNLSVLAPEMKLYGIDLSQEQINFLRESYPDLKAEIKQANVTTPLPDNFFPKTDLSFTQAVIMHIHTNDSHKVALANLFNQSNKYVVMIERWKNHQFMDDIKELFNKKMISWNNLYFYYKSDETNRPHLIICSNEPLPPVYPTLNNYEIMPQD